MKVDRKASNDISNLSKLDSSKVDRANLKSKDNAIKPDGASANRSAEIDSAVRFDLSPRAQDMKKIKEIATSAPEVDEAKVAKFQKLIDEGKYKIDAEAIADKMVDEQLMMGE
jgi:negative regulator of flagellin synthesis FlgM